MKRSREKVTYKWTELTRNWKVWEWIVELNEAVVASLLEWTENFIKVLELKE